MEGTAIESMIVRLIGDPKQYVSAMNTAISATKSFVTRVVGSNSIINTMVAKIKSLGSSLKGLIAGQYKQYSANAKNAISSTKGFIASLFETKSALSATNNPLSQAGVGFRDLLGTIGLGYTLKSFLSSYLALQKELDESKSKIDPLVKLYEELDENLKTFREEIGKVLAEYLRPMVEVLVKWTKSLANIPESLSRIVVVFLSLITVVTSFRTISSTLSNMGISIFGPWIPILAAVAIAVSGFIDVSGGIVPTWNKIRSYVSDALGSIGSLLKNAVGALGQFANRHRVVTLAVVALAAAIATVTATIYLVSTAISAFSALMSLLYIKQGLVIAYTYAMKAAMLAWRIVMFTAGIALKGLTLLLGVGAFLGKILLLTSYIVLSTAAWLAWKAIILTTKFAIAGISTVLYTLTHGLKVTESIVEGTISAFKSIGKGISVALDAIDAVVTAVGSVFMSAFTAATAAATAALGGMSIAETLCTFGLNLLIGAVIIGLAALAALVLVLVAVVVAMGVWSLVIAPLISMVLTLASSLLLLVGNIALATLAIAGIVAAPFLASFVAISTAVSNIADAFWALGGAGSLLTSISGIFQEWGSAIYMVYEAMTLTDNAFKLAKDDIKDLTSATTGMGLAWEIVKAGFDLMMAEIKAVWPSLWKFAADSSSAVVDVISTQWTLLWLTVKDKFTSTWDELGQYIKGIWKKIGDSISEIFSTLAGQAVVMADAITHPWRAGNAADIIENMATTSRRRLERIWKDPIKVKVEVDPARKKELDDAKAKAEEALASIEGKVKEAAVKAGKSVDEALKKNTGVIAARKRLDDLRKALDILKEHNKKEEVFKKVKENATKASHAISHVNQALVGSAEAITRLQEYEMRMRRIVPEKDKDKGKPAGVPPAPVPPKPKAPVPPAVPPAGSGPAIVKAVKALKDMLDDRTKLPLPVRLVGIGPARVK